MLVALWVATSDDWYREAWALTLSTPTEGTVLRSGEIVPVSVEAGKDVNLRGVKYYWYRADEEPLASHQAEPAPFSPVGAESFSARFVFQQRQERASLAVGEITRGQLAGYEDFDKVLSLEPAYALISSSRWKAWRLDTSDNGWWCRCRAICRWHSHSRLRPGVPIGHRMCRSCRSMPQGS
jgi:hypothetical protein